MTRGTLILGAIVLLFWGWLAWNAYNGVREAEARVGASNPGQFAAYVGFPLLMLAVALVPLFLLARTRWSSIGTMIAVITLLVAPFYLVLLGGGV